jgi:diacylglycerol kinase family enzyme
MVFDDFGLLLSKIIPRCLVETGRPLKWTIIANPHAGGFTIRSRWKKHEEALKECCQIAEKNPLRENCIPSKTALDSGGLTGSLGLISTGQSGHAREITGKLIKEAFDNAAALGKTDSRPFYLIITAGGDGTSLEVMSGLYYANEELRRDFVILRLPMGTGNDGADAWDLSEALKLIIFPSHIHAQRALRLTTSSGKGPFLAFNILSVGLDAFVTHMTNKMKGKLPGDSYKLWVDIAALLYDRIFKVGFMDVSSTDEKGEKIKIKEKLLLLAVGESGRRCYGSQKWILPDERNICVIKQMPLLKKLALKGEFSKGKHIDRSEAKLWTASKVEFTAQYPLLAQMDGETVLLEEKDFPAQIELSPPLIPILERHE